MAGAGVWQTAAAAHTPATSQQRESNRAATLVSQAVKTSVYTALESQGQLTGLGATASSGDDADAARRRRTRKATSRESQATYCLKILAACFQLRFRCNHNVGARTSAPAPAPSAFSQHAVKTLLCCVCAGGGAGHTTLRTRRMSTERMHTTPLMAAHTQTWRHLPRTRHSPAMPRHVHLCACLRARLLV